MNDGRDEALHSQGKWWTSRFADKVDDGQGCLSWHRHTQVAVTATISASLKQSPRQLIVTIRAQLLATAHCLLTLLACHPRQLINHNAIYQRTAYILPNRFDSFLLTDHSLLTIRVTSRPSEGTPTACSFGRLWSVPLCFVSVSLGSNYQALYSTVFRLHVSVSSVEDACTLFAKWLCQWAWASD